jgi:hypothetical protein
MPLVWSETYRLTQESPAGVAGWPMTAVLAFSVSGNARTEFHLGRLRFLIWQTTMAGNTWAAPFLNADLAVDYFLPDVFIPSDFAQMGLLTVRMDASRVLTLRKNGEQRGQTIVDAVSDAAWNADLPLGVSMSQVVGDPADAVLSIAHMAIFDTALSDDDCFAVETMLAQYSGVTL